MQVPRKERREGRQGRVPPKSQKATCHISIFCDDRLPNTFPSCNQRQREADKAEIRVRARRCSTTCFESRIVFFYPAIASMNHVWVFGRSIVSVHSCILICTWQSLFWADMVFVHLSYVWNGELHAFGILSAWYGHKHPRGLRASVGGISASWPSNQLRIPRYLERVSVAESTTMKQLKGMITARWKRHNASSFTGGLPPD